MCAHIFSKHTSFSIDTQNRYFQDKDCFNSGKASDDILKIILKMSSNYLSPFSTNIFNAI